MEGVWVWVFCVCGCFVCVDVWMGGVLKDATCRRDQQGNEYAVG